MVKKNAQYNVYNGTDFDEIHFKTNASLVEGLDKNAVGLNNVDNIQQATKTEFNAHLADFTLQVPYGGTTTNVGNAYSIATPAISALTAGMAIAVKINADSTGASTLNWNGKGAKPIKKANGTDVTNLKANGIYTLRYDGTNFTLQGEGASGNAIASDLRSGKTATTDAGDITGILDLNQLTPENLRLGITIDGIVGRLKEGAIISTQHGVMRFASGSATVDVNISPVNMAKSIIIINGQAFASTSSDQSTQHLIRGIFTSNSKITFSRGRNNIAINFTWTVIEFNSAINVQAVTKNISYDDSNLSPIDTNISKIDIGRSFLIKQSQASYVGAIPRVYLLDTQTIRLDSFYAHAGGTTYSSITTVYLVEI